MPKRLTLLRHAEALPPFQEQADLDRALTPAGLAQCARLRERFSTMSFDVVAVSPAVRTRETARRAVQDGVGFDIRPRLYQASADELEALARALPETCGHALVVAHNPGLTVLVSRLATGLSDMEPADAVSFLVDGAWDEPLKDTCRLDWRFTP